MRSVWGVSAQGPYLRFFSANGRTRAALAISADGAPGLFLTDEAGRTRAVIAVSKTGQPTLTFLRPDGKPRAVLVAEEDGMAALALMAADGVSKGSLAVSAEGSGELQLKHGALHVGLGGSKDEPPMLSFLDANGHPRIRLQLRKDGTPRLDLLDEQGKALFKAP